MFFTQSHKSHIFWIAKRFSYKSAGDEDYNDLSTPAKKAIISHLRNPVFKLELIMEED